jgi:hypothetical protein
MASHMGRSRLVLGLLVGMFALAPFGAARAQTLSDGMAALDAKYRRHSVLIRGLFKGEPKADSNDPQHVEAIDMAAKYDTYRVYLDHLETRQEKRPTLTIDRAFKEYEGNVEAITKDKDRERMQPLGVIYREKVRIHALEVLEYEKAKPIHKIHNARILAKVAELGEGKLAETLIKVLKDNNQNDAVRYYALRGLRNLLAQVQPQQMPPLLNKEEEGKCAEAIIEFLQRKPDLTPEASQEEKDGFRVLRREGVRALAQIRTPAVNDKVRPAFVLAQFAGTDERIQPPPRIDERLEAAMGLARMSSAQDKSYQPDYAASMIGTFLAAFGTAANGDKEGKSAERLRPWKIDAVHLREALAVLNADSGKNAYVAQVIAHGNSVLQAVSRGDDAKPDDLTWFTNPDNASPSKELFKGAADSAVKPAKPAEPAEK